MNIIAWLVLGLIAGALAKLIANKPIPIPSTVLTMGSCNKHSSVGVAIPKH